MINQIEHTNLLKTLHIKGSSLILLNILNVGGAKIAKEVGLQAIATSSWSVATAHGYEDGQLFSPKT